MKKKVRPKSQKSIPIKNNTPLISIIIPCYNQGHFLREAIDSVLSYSDTSIYELIIVNDGSTATESLEILEQLKNEGYHIIDQSNNGLGNARNTGIAASKGKYILPLDCDNKIRSTYIEKGIDILESNKNIGVVYGDYQNFGNRTGILTNLHFDPKRLFSANYIDACAIYRRSIWEELNGYDEKMPFMGMEDWDFWMRVVLKGWDFHYINEVLFDYRVRVDSMYRTTTLKNEQLIREYIFSKPIYKFAKNLADTSRAYDVLKKNTMSRKWLIKRFVEITLSKF